MQDILVFSHMMKTAGTSLSKHLIEYFGKGVHIVPGGLSINSIDRYDNIQLEADYKKKNKNLKVLIGHPIRSHIDLKIDGVNLRWFTFIRNPEKRYLSHYIHMFHWSNQFTNKRYNAMKEVNIQEWEKVATCSNYQCKFISGEANAQKAIDILESKFEWVGLTEEYKTGIISFKNQFNLEDLYVEEKVSNKSLSSDELKEEIKTKYNDFIFENNTEDRKLYDYVKANMWPKFSKLAEESPEKTRTKSNSFMRRLNLIEFQIDRQRNFSKTKINSKNIKRFYDRWIK